MWMRKPTPVTTPSIMRVRWSTERAKLTWKPVMAIHGWLTMPKVSGAPGAFMKAQSHATRIAGMAVQISATAETRARGSLRPTVPLMRKPVKGSSGISQRYEAGISSSRVSEFHQVDLIDVQGLACTEDSNDDGQADGGFRSGDDHDEEDEDLSGDLVPHVREGDEGKVDGVEHQLNGHEDGDDVALDEERRDAGGKEDGGKDEVVGDRDSHC